MEQLKRCVSDLLHSNQTGASGNQIYLSVLTLKLEPSEVSLFTEVLPGIYRLFETGKARKDLFFLSASCNECGNVAEELSRYEQENCVLNVADPVQVFNFCVYKKKHWFLEVVEREDYDDRFPGPVRQKISLLRLFRSTNTGNFSDLAGAVGYVHENRDEFVNVYTHHVQCVIELVNFLKGMNDDVTHSDVYNFVTGHTIVQSVEKYLDLDRLKNWEPVLRKIDECRRNYDDVFGASSEPKRYSQHETFASFVILADVVRCLKLSRTSCDENIDANGDEIIRILQNVKKTILNLQNRSKQIEVLEDIFVTVFMRGYGDTSGFYCTQFEVRLVITFLKSVLDDVRTANQLVGGAEESRKFLELDKYVCDAFWRLDLVENIDVPEDGDTEKRAMNDLFYYMLSTPEALVNLCLRRKRYEKALEVIKVIIHIPS